jgi:hypothetical protein
MLKTSERSGAWDSRTYSANRIGATLLGPNQATNICAGRASSLRQNETAIAAGRATSSTNDLEDRAQVLVEAREGPRQLLSGAAEHERGDERRHRPVADRRVGEPDRHPSERFNHHVSCGRGGITTALGDQEKYQHERQRESVIEP